MSILFPIYKFSLKIRFLLSFKQDTRAAVLNLYGGGGRGKLVHVSGGPMDVSRIACALWPTAHTTHFQTGHNSVMGHGLGVGDSYTRVL